MDAKLIKNLQKITSFPSVSGNERELALWLKKELELLADRVLVDSIGNLIAIKGKPKTAIFAHLDKVGFIISENKTDSIKAVPIKSKEAFSGFGKGMVSSVLIGDQKLEGSLIDLKGGGKEFELDVSHSDSRLVQTGDLVAIAPNFDFLNESLVSSQGLDNALGVLAGMEVFRKTADIAFVGTVQEEFTHLGAKVAAQTLKPSKVIVLDATYDQTSIKESLVVVGKGPSICLKDSLFPDPKLVKTLVFEAGQLKIPYQLEVLESGGSDALGFYDLFGGLPFVFVGIPVRFMHTPWEVGSMDDLQGAIKLLTAFLENLEGK